jgi:hypothetical protein
VKRKRRIEIIRYSRRVTVIQGVVPPADPTAIIHPQVIDVTPGARDGTPPAPEGKDRGLDASDATARETQRRRSAFKLRDLLRLRR